jgi:hypothetical protein
MEQLRQKQIARDAGLPEPSFKMTKEERRVCTPIAPTTDEAAGAPGAHRAHITRGERTHPGGELSIQLGTADRHSLHRSHTDEAPVAPSSHHTG